MIGIEIIALPITLRVFIMGCTGGLRLCILFCDTFESMMTLLLASGRSFGEIPVVNQISEYQFEVLFQFPSVPKNHIVCGADTRGQYILFGVSQLRSFVLSQEII